MRVGVGVGARLCVLVWASARESASVRVDKDESARVLRIVYCVLRIVYCALCIVCVLCIVFCVLCIPSHVCCAL